MTAPLAGAPLENALAMAGEGIVATPVGRQGGPHRGGLDAGCVTCPGGTDPVCRTALQAFERVVASAPVQAGATHLPRSGTWWVRIQAPRTIGLTSKGRNACHNLPVQSDRQMTGRPGIVALIRRLTARSPPAERRRQVAITPKRSMPPDLGAQRQEIVGVARIATWIW
jgi:hypothetical protein